MGASLTAVLLFIIYSRAHEAVAPRLRLALILGAAVSGVLVLSGGVASALRSRPGKLFALFSGWFVVTIPFSLYKSGSLHILTHIFAYALLCFLATAGLIRNVAHFRRVTRAIVLGVWTILVLASFGGEVSADRLAISSAIAESLENPNDLAASLLLGLPFCIAPVLDSRRSRGVRLLFAAAAGIPALMIVRTGSRMGLVGLLVVTLLYLLRRSLKEAVLGLAVLVPAAAILAMTLPDTLAARYKTILHTEAGAAADPSGQDASIEASKAAGSTNQRLRLFRAGLVTTALHPLFGVGAGQFGTAMAAVPEWQLAWRQPHNTYIQLSSELGIPGLILYVAGVACCIRMSFRIYKSSRRRRSQEHITAMAYSLFVSLLILAVIGMFGHFAYAAMPLTLCGLVVALDRITGQGTPHPPAQAGGAVPDRTAGAPKGREDAFSRRRTVTPA